jgi:ribosome biogenesis GTPase A
MTQHAFETDLEPAALEPPAMIFGHAEFIETVEDPSVTYDPAEALAEALELVQTVALHTLDPVTADALGRPLQDRVRQLSGWVRARATGMFRITVIGEFKRGKSTLVNALLGQSAAPSSALPETLLVSRYRWGETFSAQLKYADGGRRTLERPDLNREQLNRIIADRSRPTEGVDVAVPSEFVSDSLLVDTPGLTDLDAATRRQVLDEVANSDLIVVVASAGLQLSMSERNLLKALVKPHEFARILFVVNGIDAVEDEADLVRLHQAMAREAGNLFPGARLHMVSARDELALRTEGARPHPARAAALAQAFDDFRDEVLNLVSDQKALIRTDRVLAAAQTALGEMAGRVRMVSHQLVAEQNGLSRSLVATSQAGAMVEADFASRARSLKGEVAALGQVASEWMEEFATRLAQTLPPQLAELAADDVDRELQFFLCDAAQSALAACLAAHQVELEALAARVGLEEDLALNSGLSDRGRQAARVAYTGPQMATSAIVRQVIHQMSGAGLVVDLGMALAKSAGAGRGVRAAGVQSLLDSRKLADSLVAMTLDTYADLGDRLGKALQAMSSAAVQAAIEAGTQAKVLAEAQSDQIQLSSQVLERLTDRIEEAGTRVRAMRQRIA